MSRTYFCRLKNCQHPPVNGSAPDNFCPSCQKATLWRTEPWIFIQLDMPTWDLTVNDKRFLRSRGISPE